MENKEKNLAQVYHFDVYGKRDDKYEFLSENSLDTIEWNELENKEPSFFFVPKDFANEESYVKGFAVVDLFPFKTSGVKTHDDLNLVASDYEQLKNNIVRLKNDFESSKVFKYSYRPFDTGVIYYDTKLLGRAREKTIYHLKYNNIGLVLVAQPQAANLNYFDCVYITNCLTDTNMYRRGGPSTFPLYLYPEKSDGEMPDVEDGGAFRLRSMTRSGGAGLLGQRRVPNLNMEIVNQIAEKIGLTFSNEKEESEDSFAPIDILDYIYAVLHSPTYREKYKEFLKIDFPRVPYPDNIEMFRQLVILGGELRQIHLLESPKVEEYITSYPKDGENRITTKIGKKDWELFDVENQLGRIWINDEQYFDKIPLVVWEFYIGGYQPAQKWLKDRKERILNYEDILHYQKIIVALYETDRIMTEIDKCKIA